MKSETNILIIDNYDSFTYNLLHYLEQFVDDVQVKRPNEINLNEVQKFSGIVISPGPGLPSDYLLVQQVIQAYYTRKSILGICLGHQALCEFFGAKLKNMQEVHHGMQRNTIHFANSELFNDVPVQFESGRYHSWVIDKECVPVNIVVTAEDEEQKEIMAFQHADLPIVGVQFHPESIMTPYGKGMLKNWIEIFVRQS